MTTSRRRTRSQFGAAAVKEEGGAGDGETVRIRSVLCTERRVPILI